MASVTQDSELMTAYRAASHVVAGGKFQSFRDGSLHPALITQSNENKVYAVVADPKTGQRFAHDAVDFFKLPGSILDFELRQYDDRVSFVFTTSSSYNIHLFHGITSDELWDIPESKKFQGSVPEPKKLFLSDNVDSDDLPSLFYTHARPGESQEVLLHPITVNAGDNSLTSNDAWSLHGNITDVLAVAAGVCEYGKGAFVLYKGYQDDKRYVQFRNDVLEGVDQFYVDFPVHDAHTCLATYVDPDTDCSALVLAGEQLDMYTDDQYIYNDAKAAATVKGSLGITALHVAQQEDHITIWYTDKAEAAYYYNTKHSAFSDGLKIQFLPKGAGRTISGMLWEHAEQETVIQTLTTTNDDGFFTVWQQSLSTGFWDPLPFHVDAPSKTTTMSAYAVRFRASVPGSPRAVANCQMEITASGVAQVYANGTSVIIGPNSSLLKADANGVLNLVIPSRDIVCHEIQVTKIHPNNGDSPIPVNTSSFEPSHKVASKLAIIQTAQDLWDAKTQDGKPVIPPNSITSDQADAAASGISNAIIARQSFKVSSSLAKAPRLVRRRPHHTQFGLFSWWDTLVDLFNKGLDAAEEGLQALKTTLEKIDESLPDGPWKLVVHYFEEPFEFLIDTATTALKAAGFIIKVIQKGWEMIKDWLGFFFHWDDIKTTSYSIKAWFDSGFDWATAKIDDLDGVVDKYCNELTNRIGNVPSPNSYSPQTLSSQSNSDLTDLKHSVAYNWGFDTLMQTGTLPDISSAKMSTNQLDAGNDLVVDTYNSIKRLLSDVETTAKNIFGDVKDWFSEDMSTSEIFKRIGDDLLKGTVKVAADVIHLLLQIIKDIIDTLRHWAENELVIPIITDLWNSLTGQSLSFIGVISFVLAIPLTMLSQALTKSAPPDLSDLTKHSWDSYAIHSSREASINASIDQMNYFGNLLTAVCEDGEDFAKGYRMVMDSIDAATIYDVVANVNLFDLIILDVKFLIRVPPYGMPWKEPRKTIEHIIIYGAGIIDVAFLAGCMGARAAAGGTISHKQISAVQSLGSFLCNTADTTCRIIIGVDELNYEEEWPIYHFIEAGFSFVASGADMTAAALNVADQPEAAVIAGAIGKVAFIVFAFVTVNELGRKYIKDL